MSRDYGYAMSLPLRQITLRCAAYADMPLIAYADREYVIRHHRRFTPMPITPPLLPAMPLSPLLPPIRALPFDI